MRRRSIALAAALVAVSGACGSGSDESSATVPDITLLPTTVDSEFFASNDSAPAPSPTGGVDATMPTDGSDPAVTADPQPPAGSAPPPGVSDPDAASGAPSAPTSDAASAAALDDRLELTTSGVGSTSFGADPDGTVAFVSSLLGPPSSDTGWVDPFDIGVCDGSRLRQVAWGDLQLEFGDVSDVTEGRDHFYAYTYGTEGSVTADPPGLATPEEITVGSTVADLLRAYPGTELILGDDISPPSFSVNENLSGRLSGLADTDSVEVVVGGLPCQT